MLRPRHQLDYFSRNPYGLWKKKSRFKAFMRSVSFGRLFIRERFAPSDPRRYQISMGLVFVILAVVYFILGLDPTPPQTQPNADMPGNFFCLAIPLGIFGICWMLGVFWGGGK